MAKLSKREPLQEEVIMKKGLIVGLVLAAVSRGAVSSAHAQVAIVPADASSAEQAFSAAKAQFEAEIAEQRARVKMDKGLKSLGFGVQQWKCGADRYVLIYGDTESPAEIKILVSGYTMEVAGKDAKLDARSAVDFLAKTKDLELIKMLIADLKANGMAQKSADLRPFDNCDYGPEF